LPSTIRFDFNDESGTQYIFDKNDIEFLSSSAQLRKNYESPANIVLGQIPTTNSLASNNLNRITDGLKGIYADISDATPSNENLKFDFITERKLNKMKLFELPGSVRAYLVVRISVDNIDWDYIHNSDVNNVLGFGVGEDSSYSVTELGKVIDFQGKQARYIEIYPGPDSLSGLIEIDEIEITQFTYPTNKTGLLRVKTPELTNLFANMDWFTTLINSDLKMNIQLDDLVYYWNGTQFERFKETAFLSMHSGGEAYYKSNTLLEIKQNWGLLQTNYSTRRVTFWLHLKSYDGVNTSTIDWLDFTYDVDHSHESTTAIVEVFGSVKDFGYDGQAGLRVTAILRNIGGISHRTDSYESFVTKSVTTTTNEDGSWTLPLMRTDGIIGGDQSKWEVIIDEFGSYGQFRIKNTDPNSVSIKGLIENEKLRRLV